MSGSGVKVNVVGSWEKSLPQPEDMVEAGPGCQLPPVSSPVLTADSLDMSLLLSELTSLTLSARSDYRPG